MIEIFKNITQRFCVIQKRFLVIHKIDSIGIFALLKFERSIQLLVDTVDLKYHVKRKFASMVI